MRYFDLIVQAVAVVIAGVCMCQEAFGNDTGFEVLRTLPTGRDASASLVLDADDNAFGVMKHGGISNKDEGSGNGCVYKIDPDGEFHTLYAFQGFPTDGGKPCTALLLGSDGFIYGINSRGAAHGNGGIFRLSYSGSFQLLHSYIDAESRTVSYPTGSKSALVEGADGHLYGTSLIGGNYGAGTFYRLTKSGSFTVLHHFHEAEKDGVLQASFPHGRFHQGSDGNFYGTCMRGGPDRNGVFYRMSTSGSLTPFFPYSYYGPYPHPDGLAKGQDGRFYATSLVRRSTPQRILYSLSESGSLRDEYVFDSAYTFGGEHAGVSQSPDGDWFGIYDDSAYRIRPGGNAEMYDLNTDRTFYFDSPAGSLAFDSAGRAYCAIGGVDRDSRNGPGRVLRIDSSGTVKIIHDSRDYGAVLGLTAASDGCVYAVMQSGGYPASPSGGKIWRITASGEASIIHEFANVENGAEPMTALTEWHDGNLYGATRRGGQYDFGTFYQLTPEGEFSVLLHFTEAFKFFDHTNYVLGPRGDLYAIGSQIFSTPLYRVTRGHQMEILANLPDSVYRHPIQAGDDALVLGSRKDWIGTCRIDIHEVSKGRTGLFFERDIEPFYNFFRGAGGAIYFGAESTIFKMKAPWVIESVWRNTQASSRNFLFRPDNSYCGVYFATEEAPYGGLANFRSTGEAEVLHRFGGKEGFETGIAPVFGDDGNLYGYGGFTFWRWKYGDEEVQYQPDVRVGIKVFPFDGENIYSSRAEQQAVLLKVSPQRARSTFFTIENDGTGGDSFSVVATPGDASLSVQYLAGGSDITRSVVSGGFETPRLQPGGLFEIEAKIRSQKTSTATRRVLRLQTRSTINPDKADAADVFIKVIKP